MPETYYCAGCGRRRALDLCFFGFNQGRYEGTVAACVCGSHTVHTYPGPRKNGHHRNDYNKRRHYRYARIMKQVAGELFFEKFGGNTPRIFRATTI